jgi:hypothetical protein
LIVRERAFQRARETEAGSATSQERERLTRAVIETKSGLTVLDKEATRASN